MIRSVIAFLLACLFSTALNGQRILKKSIPQKHGQFVHIAAHNAFELNLSTSDSYYLTAEAVVEGEYQNEVLLNLWEDGRDIFIEADFHPDYKVRNDKLGAHKVLSIGMTVSIPEGHSVNVEGSSAHFKILGTYRQLQVNLQDGRCDLNNVLGEVEVLTGTADIYLTTDGGSIDASSQYGLVQQDQIPDGYSQYVLKSKSGKIGISNSF